MPIVVIRVTGETDLPAAHFIGGFRVRCVYFEMALFFLFGFQWKAILLRVHHTIAMRVSLSNQCRFTRRLKAASSNV